MEKLEAFNQGEHPQAKSLRRARKRVGRIKTAVFSALTLYLIFYCIKPWANELEALPPFASTLIFIFKIGVVYGLVSLPFEYASGYQIEKKFGLSNQSLKDWAKDLFKGGLVGVVLGTVIISGLTACLLYSGQNWWWIASLFATIFGIILTRIAPQILLPMFFKLKPIESVELQERFKNLAAKTQTPILGIFEIDMSRRTNTANAAVVGFGSTRKAIVGDTLLSNFSNDEIEFVLAHELAHHRYHDLWSGIAMGAVLTFLGLGLTHLLLTHFSYILGFEFPYHNPAIVFWIGLTNSFIGKIFAPIGKLLSRFMETRADTFAAITTKNPGAGAAAFKRLGYQNLAVFRPPVWEELLFYTHPCLARRIERLEQH